MSGYDEVMIIENMFNKEECSQAIDEIEAIIKSGVYMDITSSVYRKDEAIHYSVVSGVGNKMPGIFLERFHNTVIPEYKNRFPVLNQRQMGTFEVKGQKTPPGGGFHGWHYEASDGVTYNRILTYTLYLNDDFEAGETEFLSLNRRIEPKAGMCVVFPCGFLHTHRGNPPIGACKYIITGWVVDVDPYSPHRH